MPRKKTVVQSQAGATVSLNDQALAYAKQIMQLEPYETMLLQPTGEINRERRYVVPFHGEEVYKVLNEHDLNTVEVITERFQVTDRILICVRQNPTVFSEH